MHGAGFVFDLAIVLGVAGVTAVLARRFRQPTILGYLLAGLIVGPYIPIPLFADQHRVEALAELGVVLVMFAVGLEFRIAKLMRVLPVSGVTALVQVGFLLWAGFTLGELLGRPPREALFLGAAICISSTMVVTRVFDDVEVPGDVRQHVLGILVIQDVLAIVIIAALTAVAAGEGLAARDLASVLGKLGGVLLGLLGVGLLVVPRAIRKVAGAKSPELLAVVAVGLCFIIGAVAEGLGFSVALGAFVAGILVAESGREKEIEHLVAPLRDIFAAIFFVSIGMTVEPGEALAHLPTSLLLVVLIVLGQLVSITAAGVLSGSGLRRSLFAGLALGQVGELGFIVVGLGVTAGVVSPDLRPILVTVSALTAFTTPLLLRQAPRLARAVDQLLPGRFHRLIALYESWFEGWRSRPRPSLEGSSTILRAVRNLVFDGIATTVVVALSLAWSEAGAHWIAGQTGWSERAARGSFGLAVVCLLLPILFALLRNAMALSRAMAEQIDPPLGPLTVQRKLVRRLIRSTVHLLVALGVGLPALAILRPLLPGPFGIPILFVVIASLATYILRDVRKLDAALASGAAGVAARLSAEMSHDPTLPPPSPEVPTNTESNMDLEAVLPGLDRVVGWRVPEGCWADGRTLAEMDLRASTGVAVVAIQRQGGQISLPKGDDTIRGEDLLGLLGGPEAIVEAQAFLQTGPEG